MTNKTESMVSFVIPCYNVENYIVNCVNSIISQDYNNIEIILVDDGSKDSTGKIIDNIAKKNSNIRVIHKENSGVSSARNDGIKYSTGDYIVFVDADDYLSKDYTAYMVNIISSQDADMALSMNCYTKLNEKQIVKDIIETYDSEKATALLLGPRVIVGCWNKIYRRDFVVKNKLRFSPTQFYGEGLLFITTATQLAKRIAVGRRKVYYYRRNNYASACTKFKIENFYNGFQSIKLIENNLILKTPLVLEMLAWHRCQFKMGTVVRIKSAKASQQYMSYYEESLKYVRHNMWPILLNNKLSLYKRGLILGTAISPSLMAFLDKIRRESIQNNSIS